MSRQKKQWCISMPKIDNLKASPDNTKHTYLHLPNDYSVLCLKILEKNILAKILEIENNGNVIKFESTIPFFHLKRHAPQTNPTNDMNISAVECSIFALTQSMQNVQTLTGTGSCAKYVCKYIANIDDQNYYVIEVNWEGRLVSKDTFLYNTKFSYSKSTEDKERNKNYNSPQ